MSAHDIATRIIYALVSGTRKIGEQSKSRERDAADRRDLLPIRSHGNAEVVADLYYRRSLHGITRLGRKLDY